MVSFQQHNFYENYTILTCNLAILYYADRCLHCYGIVIIVKP